MKRLLISFICILTFAALSAQNYSELDLIGEWNLVEGTGILNLETLSVNDRSVVHRNYVEDMGKFKTKKGDYDYCIKDIFIASGNIIHIYMAPSEYSTNPNLTRVRIKIKSLESGVLTLSSLDGNSNFILKKKETTDIASAKEYDSDNNVYYNLQGMKINNLANQEVYIHNGKKYTSK